MCLTIYTNKSQIPKEIILIDYNDLFFESVNLVDNEVTKKILSDIDKAKYNSPLTFIGRDNSIGALNKSNLSTGTKTLLNIVTNKDKCFSVSECGQNALSFIPHIKEGHILWEVPVLHYLGDCEQCDIKIDDKEFKDFDAFLSYIMDRGV